MAYLTILVLISSQSDRIRQQRSHLQSSDEIQSSKTSFDVYRHVPVTKKFMSLQGLFTIPSKCKKKKIRSKQTYVHHELSVLRRRPNVVHGGKALVNLPEMESVLLERIHIALKPLNSRLPVFLRHSMSQSLIRLRVTISRHCTFAIKEKRRDYAGCMRRFEYLLLLRPLHNALAQSGNLFFIAFLNLQSGAQSVAPSRGDSLRRLHH